MALDAEKSRCDSLERARVEAQNSLEQATLDVCELQAKFAASGLGISKSPPHVLYFVIHIFFLASDFVL